MTDERIERLRSTVTRYGNAEDVTDLDSLEREFTELREALQRIAAYPQAETGVEGRYLARLARTALSHHDEVTG